MARDDESGLNGSSIWLGTTKLGKLLNLAVAVRYLESYLNPKPKTLNPRP